MEEAKVVEELKKIMNETDTVSLSVALVKHGEIVWRYCTGYRDKDKKIETDRSVYYRMASVSKLVSAMTMMTLVDKGLANLDEDISKYLGYKVRNPYFEDVPIKLRYLMTHTSTLIETGNYNKLCAGELPPYKLSEILPVGTPGYTKDNFYKAEPGTVYNYSSFETGILGTIVEKITGKRFCDYAAEAIFKPLGLQCSYDPDLLPSDAIVAIPYEVTPGDNAQGRGEHWLENSLKNKKKLYSLPIGEAYRMAQGNLHANPEHLARIMMVFLGKGISQGVRILSENAVEEMLKIQYQSEKITTGLNVHHFDHTIVDDWYIKGHFGRAFGAFNACFFNEEKDLGVMFCTNGTNAKLNKWGYNDTCGRLLSVLFPFVDTI